MFDFQSDFRLSILDYGRISVESSHDKVLDLNNWVCLSQPLTFSLFISPRTTSSKKKIIAHQQAQVNFNNSPLSSNCVARNVLGGHGRRVNKRFGSTQSDRIKPWRHKLLFSVQAKKNNKKLKLNRCFGVVVFVTQRYNQWRGGHFTLTVRNPVLVSVTRVIHADNTMGFGKSFFLPPIMHRHWRDHEKTREIMKSTHFLLRSQRMPLEPQCFCC